MGRRDFFEERKLKRLVYIFAITLVISIIAFVIIFVMYNNKLKEEANNKLLSLEQIKDIVPNEDLTEASSTSDKDISSAKNTTAKNNTIKQEKKNTVSKTPISSKVTNISNTTNTDNNAVNNGVTNQIANTVDNNSEQEDLSFCAPVSGEIIKDFANDSLIYSNTLEEWTTHLRN